MGAKGHYLDSCRVLCVEPLGKVLVEVVKERPDDTMVTGKLAGFDIAVQCEESELSNQLALAVKNTIDMWIHVYENRYNLQDLQKGDSN